MHEIIETMGWREKMLKWYGEIMPPEIGPARRELGISGVKWMVERRMEENEEMMKEEAMRDGVKKRSFS